MVDSARQIQSRASTICHLSVCVYCLVQARVFHADVLNVACIHLHHPDMHIMYLAYISNLMHMFVSSTNFAITCEVEVAVGCFLAYICKTVRFIWHAYLFSYICQICV